MTPIIRHFFKCFRYIKLLRYILETLIKHIFFLSTGIYLIVCIYRQFITSEVTQFYDFIKIIQKLIIFVFFFGLKI